MKFIYKAGFAAALTASLAVTQVAGASTLTSAQVSAIINLLQAFGADASVVANVQTVLNGGTPAATSGSWCHTFEKNLKIDDSGIEVWYLARALKREDTLHYLQGDLEHYTSNKWMSIEFTENMADSVSAFQEKYKSEILSPNGLSHGTGYVGASTRAKLNKLYGCGNVTPPPPENYPPMPAAIKVISPNGGENLARGAQKLIEWEDNTSQTPKAFDIKLVPYYASSLTIPSHTIFLGVKTKWFSWEIGHVYIPDTMPNSGEDSFVDGMYIIEVCVSGTKVCDMSDAPFKVMLQTQTPSLKVLSPNGGEVLGVGKTYAIQWSSAGISEDTPIQIQLLKKRSGVAYDIYDVVYTLAYAENKTAKNRGSYSWTIPSVITLGEATVGIQPGQYWLSVGTGPHVVSSIGAEDMSDAPFTITSQ
jgi:hypothetical protein